MVMSVALRSQPQETPIIEFVAGSRFVKVDAVYDGEESEDDFTSNLAGPFAWIASASGTGPLGSSAQGQAEQNTQVSSFTIRGSGEVSGDVHLGGGEGATVQANARTELGVQFQVPVEAEYSLTGSFEAVGPGGPYSLAGVQFVGLRPEGTAFFDTHFFNADDDPEDAVFVFTGTVAANTNLNIQIYAQVNPEGTEEFPAGLGSAMASFDFNLDFGDRDGDGLFDSWEKNGIDFPGPGIEIDLPGMGSNPDVKDLFVEVDVMSGVPFYQQSLDDVERAFSQAPASAVRNNDGSRGIRLHLVVDGDQPSQQSIVLAGGVLPPSYYAIKDSYFGSAALRAHPNWDEIRDLWLKIFRYCLWGDSIEDPGDGGTIWGIAEAIPSNDFVVAASEVVKDIPQVPAETLAATFMHELGHTLNLKHGGQDHENRKPNYLSVMNYSYAEPIVRITEQGTNVASSWRLDYSRSTMIDLDEMLLFEELGLGGPSGRRVIFNSAKASDPEPVVRVLWWADKPFVDWNISGGEPELVGYEQDITRRDPSVSAFYDDSLLSFTDWDRLWYHLAGDVSFNDRKASPWAEKSPALDREEILAFYDVPWIDMTALDDLVFANGFELGSTTAWSDTVP